MPFAGFQGLSYLNEFSFILFIHHNIHIYFELCAYCKIGDIHLIYNMNSVKYLLFYMELFCDMFESVLECYELTHISWSWSAGVMQEWACIVVRRAGLIWSTYLIASRFWVVVICPIIKCLTVLEFSFILFALCLFITIFNFILNYVPIVTFWIFTYHKIWILLIIFCFIWNYWIIYFLTCLEVFWSVVS